MQYPSGRRQSALVTPRTGTGQVPSRSGESCSYEAAKIPGINASPTGWRSEQPSPRGCRSRQQVSSSRAVVVVQLELRRPPGTDNPVPGAPHNHPPDRAKAREAWPGKKSGKQREIRKSVRKWFWLVFVGVGKPLPDTPPPEGDHRKRRRKDCRKRQQRKSSDSHCTLREMLRGCSGGCVWARFQGFSVAVGGWRGGSDGPIVWDVV